MLIGNTDKLSGTTFWTEEGAVGWLMNSNGILEISKAAKSYVQE
jgi:hypothetical protein